MKKLALVGGIVVAVAACSIGSEIAENREKQYLERSIDPARIWNSASQYYGYWDHLGGTEQWDSAYEKAVVGLTDCRTDFDYYALLEEFLSVLQDGRAGVQDGSGIGWFPDGFQTEAVQLDWGVLPFWAEVMEGRLLVSGCLSGSEIPLYAEITQLDGRAPFDYLEEEYGKRVGGQAEGGRMGMLASAMRFAEAGKKLRVSFENASGEARTVSVSYERGDLAAPAAETAGLPAMGDLVYEGEYLRIYEKSKISCVEFLGLNGQAAVREFEEKALPVLLESSGCILDLRGCSNGDSTAASEIIQYFSEEKLPPFIRSYSLRSGLEMRIARQLEYQIPGSERYEGTELAERGAAMNSGQYYYCLPGENEAFCESVKKINEEELKEIEELYSQESETKEARQLSGDSVCQKPCVMLIDKKTTAGGECMAAMAREANVMLIGENTAGVFGDAVMEQLSNGWIVMFSAGNIYTPGGDVIWNQGIAPDVELPVSLEDYRAGRDTTMEWAVEYLGNKES